MRILFVCMGNICRSAAAEGYFRHILDEAGLLDEYVVDSAGTIGYHAGSPADGRMQDAAAERGYRLDSRSRRVVVEDFDRFDLILAMDRDNLSDLKSLQQQSNSGAELKLFCEYCRDHDLQDVPDPYYGGARGFEIVLDIVEDGCRELLGSRK